MGNVAAIRASLAMMIVFLCTAQAEAGSPSRPYLVWANLHEDHNPEVTTTINKYIDSLPPDEFCNDSAYAWIIYGKSRPPGFSNTAIEKAIQQKHPTRKAIVAKIVQFRDKDIYEGLDGIVAYSENKAPRMVSIDARGILKKSTLIKNTKNSAEVIAAFCSVIPETYRK